MQSSQGLLKETYDQKTDMIDNKDMLGTRIPHESLESRRLSQTNVRASIDMSLREPQDLHKWAAEAMIARPGNNIAPPLETFPRSTSSSSLLNGPRRESEGGISWSSKFSAPPGGIGNSPRSYKTESSMNGTSYDTVPRYHTPNSLELQSTSRRDSFLSNGLRERPTSMFAITSPTSETGFDAILRDSTEIKNDDIDDGNPITQAISSSSVSRQGSQKQNNLKSCLKSNNLVDNERVDMPIGLQSTFSAIGNGSLVQKSVHICDDLPRLKNGMDDSSSQNSSPISSPLASRLVRRNAAHRRNESESRSIKRSNGQNDNHRRNSSHSHNSPTLTDDATYDSEEEEEEERQAVITPSDGNIPAKVMNEINSNDIPPLPNLEHIHHPERSRTKNDLVNSKNERSTQSNNNEGFGAFFSQSTLLDIGREKGLTPPSLHDGSYRLNSVPSLGTTDHSNSIVSTGLGMGLGFRMAPSTLSSQIIPTSSSTHENIDAHYDRFAGQIDLNSMTSASKVFDNAKVKSDRAADEISFDELDRDDAELNRRRTTGGLQSHRESRQSGIVGKRRVHRTGTQDPHGSTSNATGSFVSHSQLKMTTMNDVEEGIASGDSSSLSNSQSSPSMGPNRHMFGTTSTPLDTPSHGHKANLSPSIGFRADSASLFSRSGIDEERSGLRELSGATNGIANKFTLPAVNGANNLDGGLMGIGEVGHFGPGVRAKVAQLMEAFISTIPLNGQEDETVNMVEYGALNSRSALLMRPAISSLAKRAVKQVDAEEELKGNRQCYFDKWKNEGEDQNGQDRKGRRNDIQDSQLTFCITHEDSPSTDFRAMTQLLETHRESYMDAHWQAMHSPGLMNTIFPTFAARPFASRLTPPKTIHLGISLMDLHWTHTPNNAHVSRATTAQAELTTFLNTRAHEFKKDGMLFLAYIARSEDPGNPFKQMERLSSDPLMTEDDTSTYSTSPIEKGGMNSINIAELIAQTPPKKDIWTSLSNTLAPCIQRLVSCGMLKSEVARHLLDLPMHPRTAKQTRAALKSVENQWKLEWSCGLGINDEIEEGKEESIKTIPNEPKPLRLAHPAWKAFESGCLSRVPFTEHMIQLFKNLYEAHFRNVLREKGRLSKGAVEFVLDSLWDALFSRIVDQSASSANDIEIEVCIFALRRR